MWVLVGEFGGKKRTYLKCHFLLTYPEKLKTNKEGQTWLVRVTFL